MAETGMEEHKQPGDEMSGVEGRMTTKRPKLPGPPMRNARRLLYAVACLFLVSAMPLGSLGDFTVLLALLLSVAASVFAGVAVYRGIDPLVSVEQLPSKRYRCGIIASAVLCLGLSAFGMQISMAKARSAGKTAVTMANLRAICEGLNLYHEQFGMPSESLADLLDSGIIALPTFFRSVADPTPLDAVEPNSGVYSSFVYEKCPVRLSGNPRVVVAYELECWTLIKTGIFAEYGRCVLFADGQTEVLSEDEFAEAMELDAKVKSGAIPAITKPVTEAPEVGE